MSQFDTVPSIIRLPEVLNRTGLGRSTVYLKIANGTFPKPISLGARAVGWLESDVTNWVLEQVKGGGN